MDVSSWNWTSGDLAVVIATLLGPIAAVQVQKWLERSRAKEDRRIAIFRTLMATRAANLSQAHVEALNAIPIEFYGQSKKLREIINSWKSYLDHLSQRDPVMEIWVQKRTDLFLDLLVLISKYLRYDFTRVELSKEIYSPSAHSRIESEQETIRVGLAKLLSGDAALPLAIRSIYSDPETLSRQMALQEKLSAWLDSGPIVKIVAADESGGGTSETRQTQMQQLVPPRVKK